MLKVQPGWTRPHLPANTGVNTSCILNDSNFADEAIAREKEIKGWKRSQKEALINSMNPEWVFLNERLDELLSVQQMLRMTQHDEVLVLAEFSIICTNIN